MPERNAVAESRAERPQFGAGWESRRLRCLVWICLQNANWGGGGVCAREEVAAMESVPGLWLLYCTV